MGYFKAGDTISGQEATATINIKQSDGTTVVQDLFFAKNVDAKCTINKTDVKTLGKRGTQHKPNGWTGEGSMDVYYASSVFRNMAIQYIKTGKPVYFDLTVTNNDPGSTVGAQTTMLIDCTLNTVSLAKFDVDSEVLDESVDFTFEDADLLNEFGEPVLG
jgi:hypothetical protein